jgi:hypothetical protein
MGNPIRQLPPARNRPSRLADYSTAKTENRKQCLRLGLGPEDASIPVPLRQAMMQLDGRDRLGQVCCGLGDVTWGRAAPQAC